MYVPGVVLLLITMKHSAIACMGVTVGLLPTGKLDNFAFHVFTVLVLLVPCLSSWLLPYYQLNGVDCAGVIMLALCQWLEEVTHEMAPWLQSLAQSQHGKKNLNQIVSTRLRDELDELAEMCETRELGELAVLALFFGGLLSREVAGSLLAFGQGYTFGGWMAEGGWLV